MSRIIQIGTINGTVVGDETGVSVSLSSDGLILAIGAQLFDTTSNVNTGRVIIFKYNITDNSWEQIGTITGTGTGRLGFTVSLSSDGLTLAIGEPLFNNAGCVRIFRYSGSGTTWNSIGTINGSTDERTGFTVSLSSNGLTLAVGEPYNNTQTGRVRIFRYSGSGTTWDSIGTIIGTASGDRTGFGLSLSSDGLTLVVGEPLNDVGGTNAGRVRIFRYSSGVWISIGTITGSLGDQTGFGLSLSSDGSILAVGETLNDSDGTNAGRVRIFRYSGSGTTWDSIGIIKGTAAGDQTGFGLSLSSDGTILAVGDPFNDDGGAYAGRVRIFRYSSISNIWTSIGTILGTNVGDQTGRSGTVVSSDGLTIAVGDQYNSDVGSNAGRVRIFKIIQKSKTKFSGYLTRL